MKNSLRQTGLLIFWLTLSGFAMTAIWYQPWVKNPVTYLKVALFTASLWNLLWIGNRWTSHIVNKYISWTEEPVKRFTMGMIVMVLYTVGVVYIIAIFFKFVVGLNISGDLTETMYAALIITFVISLFMHGRGFLINWKEAAINAERLQKESIKSQYESLKSQVNPHFLFNSLNALTNLVHEDKDKAVTFIKQLSDVYRYVLDTRDREIVGLGEELQFLRSYVFLQQIRFGEKLKVNIEIGNDGQVAPLVLQMLIENAIKHNVVAADRPLSIRLYRDDGMMVVENNLQKKNVRPEESPGIGLDNIRKRYAFLSSKPVQAGVEDDKFVVRIPVLQ